MENKIKRGILFFLFAILWLPLLQQNFPFITSGKLDGWFTNAPADTFSPARWWAGTYQPATTNYVNDHIGFRPDFIRFGNQVDYSLFSKTHAHSVVIGKEGYLFQDLYIDGYYGADFVGDATIREKLRKLKRLQDTLESMGKTLVLVHAPCKAYYYPEYIPDRLRQPRRGITNFDEYRRIGDSIGIHQVDLNSWYISLKGKTAELLYPKQAFHWSVYGSLLAADTLERYIERRRHISMVHPRWTIVDHTSQPRYTDDDIARTCDLIFPMANEIFSYPQVTYNPGPGATKPRMIYIGDSFMLTWIYDGLMSNANSDWQVWYYFKLLYDKDHNEAQPEQWLGNTDWMSALKNTDCIVLVYTAHNLNNLGNGFIEETYKRYFGEVR